MRGIPEYIAQARTIVHAVADLRGGGGGGLGGFKPPPPLGCQKKKN